MDYPHRRHKEGCRSCEILSLLSNFFILLSYPLNFFIYCGMSKQFRTTFKSLISGAETSRGSRVTKV
ncbi:hypothetical protein RRG08_001819 [Elysia crispata]|uniref:G-protein coupled receptors family 1 profile domain-containing protein n=1 Tax=Elysia crispata TaxID=231223 RepID=A0AAE1CTJ4_9GAST|nr:hypothetical protein RRG08_001819 [Elysia crispata]